MVTMSDNRLPADRKEVTALGGCPNGCQAFELSSEGKSDAVDELLNEIQREFDECSTCRAAIGTVTTEQPSFELE